jgi:hypothetical protein
MRQVPANPYHIRPHNIQDNKITAVVRFICPLPEIPFVVISLHRGKKLAPISEVMTE